MLRRAEKREMKSKRRRDIDTELLVKMDLVSWVLENGDRKSNSLAFSSL